MGDKKKRLELKKHVAVIHSSNKLTLLQRKIANALLFNAYKDMLTKDEHEVHIADLCELIGYDSHDHRTIKNALVNLLSTVLEWNLVDGERVDSGGVWNASSIIADASIDGPICTYSYSNKMRKLLHRPNMYGRLDMHIQARFQSSYGLALYENCNRFQDVGKSPWFSMEKFRKLMGVEESKYKIFRDFKIRVLDKAVEEVNKHSDLTISPQLKREHRKVTSIQFVIQRQLEHGVLQVEEKNHFNDMSLTDLLKSQFGLSNRQIDDVVADYEESYVRQKINLICDSNSFKEGKVKNLAKYLLSALKEDYQPIKSSAPHFKQNTTQTIMYENVLETQHIQQRRELERRLEDKKIYESFENLNANQKSIILNDFVKHLSGLYYDLYQKSHFENVLIRDQLVLFLRSSHHEIVAREHST